MKGRVALVVAVVCAALASRADAATFCVEVRVAGCEPRPTAADAFAAARADGMRDTILLGRLTADGPFADAPGRPVRVIGLGADATRLRAGDGGPALRLQDPDSSAHVLRLEGPLALQIDDGARVRSSMVAGTVHVRGGNAELSSVAVSGAGAGPAVEASCEAATTRLALEHVTVTGSGSAGVNGQCLVAGRSLALTVSNTIVWGFSRGFATGPGVTLAASYSDFPGATGDTNAEVDPRFEGPGDVRLRADSPLVDAGRPGALGESEPHEDALGFVRVVDGGTDGTPRRDMGALERQRPAPAVAEGNVLANPGAEAGAPAEDDTSSPAPPGWMRSGSFTFVRYGTVAGLFPFPTRRVAEALGAGDAFFAAGPGRGNSAVQVVDLRPAAPEIDLGLGSASLSALLGGYRGSGDGAIVEAVFRAPGGRALGRVRIGPVSAAERAGATTLLPRAAEAAIPPLTRTIAVTLRSSPAAGSYDDAYFDSVALVPRTAGAPPHQEPAQGMRLRPFAGATLLTRRTAVDRRRRAWVRVACASRTVGRCRGVVTVTARVGSGPRRRAGATRFALRRGRAGRVAVRVTRGVRNALRDRRRLRGRVYVSSRDGQGLTRSTVSPVRVVRGKLWADGKRRRRAGR
jgi:hypothetical protein